MRITHVYHVRLN